MNSPLSTSIHVGEKERKICIQHFMSFTGPLKSPKKGEKWGYK